MIEGKSGRGLSAGGHYFALRENITDNSLRLLPDEARHAIKVLRLGIGDEIAVVDGAGGWYRVRIDTVDRDGLVATILERMQDVGEPACELTVAIGLLKQQTRFETFLEKAVEFGVTRVVPIMTERGQSGSLNMKRCRRILIAGLKQSLRSRLPRLTEPKAFNAVLLEDADVRLIAHEDASLEDSVLKHADALRNARSCHVLIGPEGGFADSEIDRAQKAGWTMVSLGDARLRTETAGMAAASVIQMIKSTRERS